MGAIKDVLNKVKSIFTKVTKDLPNTIKNIGTTIKTIPEKIRTLPATISTSIGTFVSDKVGAIREGFETAIDNIQNLPDTIMTGIKGTLTRPEGLLDRVGLVNDEGELRDISDLAEGAVKTTNRNILNVGNWGRDKVEIVRNKVDTAWHTGTAATAKFVKDAGRFIKDGTKKGVVLAGNFAKKVVKAQLESSGVGPFMKKHWVKFGLGASAVGGAYMFATAGMPILSVKTSLGTVTKLPKLVKTVLRLRLELPLLRSP